MQGAVANVPLDLCLTVSDWVVTGVAGSWGRAGCYASSGTQVADLAGFSALSRPDWLFVDESA